MDWQITLKRLLADTESNLRQTGFRRSSQPQKAPLVGAGSYALLRPGVPPHDPHLIAPVVAGTCGSPVCTAWGGTSDAGGVAGGLIAAARPLSSLRSPAVAQHSRGWRQELAGLGEQLRAAAGQPSGELAAVQAQLAALQSAQGSAERRQEEAAAQAALLGGQLAELGAEQRDSWRQLGTQVEQLAQLLAKMGAGQLEGQRLRQQDAGAGSCSTQQETTGPAASLECIEQLAGKMAAGAEALGGLQAQVAQLAGLPAAVEDANQRLFELRVEVQNAWEDGAIAAASAKRQAEAAERQAEEAAEVAVEVRQLAGSLQAELAQVRHQAAAAAVSDIGDELPAPLAALIRQQVAAGVEAARCELAGSGGQAAAVEAAAVAQTVDRLATELAGVKLLLAQQHEAAEAATAAARAEAAATQERCVRAALSAAEQLVQQHSPASLATTEETAACLTSLTDIVHRQQDELRRVQQGIASLEQAAGPAAARAAAAVASAGGAGTNTQATAADTLEFLSASVEQLQGQLCAATAAAEQRQAAQAAQLAALAQQLADARSEVAAGTGALWQDVAAMQRHLAVVEESSEGGLGEAPLRPQLEGVERRLAGLEVALAQQAQQSQQAQPGAEGAAAAAARSAALQSRLEGLEAALLVHQQQQQQQQEQREGAPKGEDGAQGLPAAARQELESRMRRTEATVAAALEEVAAQMAALAARAEATEAGSAASHAAHAVAAAAQGQGLPSEHSSREERWQGQLSPCSAAGAAGGLPQQRLRSLSCSPRQPEPSYAELHRQRSQPSSRAVAQHPHQQHEEPPAGISRRASASGSSSGAPAGSSDGSASASSGLFARLSRRLSGHGRRGSSGQESGRAAAAAAAVEAVHGAAAAGVAAPAGAAGVTSKQEEQGEEVALRVRYSYSGGQEAGWEDSRGDPTGHGGLNGAGSAICAAQPPAAVQPLLVRHRTRSRTDSSGSASGKYTPRSRRRASLQQGVLLQERSAGDGADGAAGASSKASTPRQPPSVLSSFGEVPLPTSASSGMLASPRERLAWEDPGGAAGG